MGNLTANFSRAEFACPHCGKVAVSRALVEMLQRMRTRKGKPLTIVSGFRCEVHNRRVGGIPSSQHRFGRAADVPGGYATADEWIAAGAIGVGVRGGRVIHVDVTPGRKPFVFND